MLAIAHIICYNNKRVKNTHEWIPVLVPKRWSAGKKKFMEELKPMEVYYERYFNETVT